MKYSQERQKYHISRIRGVLVRKPQAGCREIAQTLKDDNQSPLSLDKDYINKLIRKIEGERAKRVNYATLSISLASLEDTVNTLSTSLWEVISNSETSTSDKLKAIQTLTLLQNQLFLAKLKSGAFEVAKQSKRKRHDQQMTLAEGLELDRALKMLYSGRTRKK